MPDASLLSHLTYTPCELKFGTSGRRGLVRDITHLEIYINVLGELRYLQNTPVASGGITPGDEFFIAYDLRPSSSEIDPSTGRRGQLAQAVQRAIVATGMRPVNLGCIPTPALAFYALARHKAAIMVTGSHIPFDRNGYKLYTSEGELLKSAEASINQAVQRVREDIYGGNYSESLFNELGMFKEVDALAPQVDSARSAYIDRYRNFFRSLDLHGRSLVVFEHSAVGRDMLVELLRSFGAEVIPVGRSETFVPVDTENIDAEQLASITSLVKSALRDGVEIDAIVSTDGDSDRPLLLGWDRTAQQAVFFPGDLLGMITAQHLGADAVVVPITCNDGIDSGPLAHALEPKTKVGSPYVIEGIERARLKGRTCICGWEANGGFLLGSDIVCDGATLSALETRDAILPLITTLAVARERDESLATVFGKLPARYSRSGLLRNFARATARRMMARFTPVAETIREVRFTASGIGAFDGTGAAIDISSQAEAELRRIAQGLATVFSKELGFGELTSINYTDGLRVRFSNGDVTHVRPSGNADELRIYATSSTQDRAAEICAMGIVEPSGLLRKLEAASN